MIWARRQPMSEDDLLAWWRSALRNPDLPRHSDDPQPGWYKTRRVKGGPFIPVRITAEQDVDGVGELCAPVKIVAFCGEKEVDAREVWTYCQPVSRAEFDALERFRDDHSHRIGDTDRIDLSRMPVRP